MTVAKAPRKPNRLTGVDGLKAAISATAVAVTIGGWGWLTSQNPVEATVSTPSIIIESPLVERQPLPAWLSQPPSMPVLPTVAPLDIPSRENVANASAAPAVSAPPPVPLAPAVSVPPPALPPPPAPTLREVSVPAPASAPAPAARTRSSR
ncbi:hypothetical protein [uncultured Chloroflexus sp.]|uniref:hypothetical protein n=1 Tax=uncultured Chloroflexus sp. TaxID=214040 RepID=UPI0026143F64|nr:hypothetical protein [uncultured Chloroflexus sp.]